MGFASGLPEEVAKEEPLARALNSSRYVATTTGRIKKAAFLPAPDDDTSVFRTSGLNDREVRELIVLHRPQIAKNGAAMVTAGDIYAKSLVIAADDKPPRHANVRGWPLFPSNEAQQKLERNAIAMALAEKAKWLPAAG